MTLKKLKDSVNKDNSSKRTKRSHLKAISISLSRCCVDLFFITRGEQINQNEKISNVTISIKKSLNK